MVTARKQNGLRSAWQATGLLLACLVAGYALLGLRSSRSAVMLSPADFEGTPVFVALDGTSVEYMSNARHTILRSGTQYYLFRNGGWWVATTPVGPYRKAPLPLGLTEAAPVPTARID